jgi:hypothetical protein
MSVNILSRVVQCAIMLSEIILNEVYYTGCHYTESPCAKYRYVKSHYSDRQYIK